MKILNIILILLLIFQFFQIFCESFGKASHDMKYLEIDVLVVIYNTTAGGNASYEEIEKLKEEVNEAEEFYWRNSKLNLDLNISYVLIPRYIPISEFWELWSDCYWLPFWDVNTTDGLSNSVENDLYNLGYTKNQFDGVVVFYAWGDNEYKAALGGGSYGVEIGFMGNTGYTAIPLCWDPETNDWFFIHEFHHQLDSMFDNSGYNYPHGDKPWELDGRFGDNYDFNAYMLRNWNNWYSCLWGNIKKAKDNDADNVPDDNIFGLKITEPKIGSNPQKSDSDNDGLSDLNEIIAGIFNGTSVNAIDTDNDGINDGLDNYPLYRMKNKFFNSSIKVDGILNESWENFTDFLMQTNENYSSKTYISWDDEFLYFGFKMEKFARIKLYLDANNDGWFHGKDNYEIIFDTIGNKVLTAHIFDCSYDITSKFGYPIYDDDERYPHGRIIANDVLGYARFDGNYSVEIGIRKNMNTNLLLVNGKKIGVRIEFTWISGDWHSWATVFEKDFFVRIELLRNMPPVFSTFPIVYLPMNTFNKTALDLYKYVSDDYDSTDNLTFAIEENSAMGIIFVEINSNRWVAVDALRGEKNDNWTGIVKIKISAMDKKGLKGYGELKINITKVNQVPIWLGLPNAITYEDKSLQNWLDLKEYVKDDSKLNITIVNQTNTSVAFAYLNDTVISIDVLQNAYGFSNVTLCAYDGEYSSIANFTIIVIEVNDFPIWLELPNAITYEDKSLQNWLDLKDYVKDDSKLNITIANQTNTSVAFAYLNGTILSIDVLQNAYGFSNLTLCAYDGEYSSIANFTIIVISVNDLPEVFITSHKEKETVNGIVNISGYINDIDNSECIVYVNIDNGKWKIANGSKNWYYIWNTTEFDNGTHIIAFKAYDFLDFSEIKRISLFVANEIVASEPEDEQIDENETFSTQKKENILDFTIVAIIITGALMAIIVLMIIRKKY
ncbi:MAG: hypothetical protein AB1779_09215 [Candidatus Thermoplasmatota archaeon]